MKIILKYFLGLLLFVVPFSCASTKHLQNNVAPLIIKTGNIININGNNYQELTIESTDILQNYNNIISGYIRRKGTFVLFLPINSVKEYELLDINNWFAPTIKPKPGYATPSFEFGVFTIINTFNDCSCCRMYNVREKYTGQDYSLKRIEVIYFKKDKIKLCFHYSYLEKMYKSSIVIKSDKMPRFNRKRYRLC